KRHCVKYVERPVTLECDSCHGVRRVSRAYLNPYATDKAVRGWVIRRKGLSRSAQSYSRWLEILYIAWLSTSKERQWSCRGLLLVARVCGSSCSCHLFYSFLQAAELARHIFIGCGQNVIVLFWVQNPVPVVIRPSVKLQD